MLHEEMKKIWRSKILLVLLLIGAVFYLMYLDFYIKHFPNGPNMEAEFDVAAEIVDQYGTTLEPDEFEAYKATFPLLLDEVNTYIAEHPIAQKYALNTYFDYKDFQNSMSYSGEMTPEEQVQHSDSMLLQNYLWSSETDNISGRLYATDLYIRQYELWQGYQTDARTGTFDNSYSQREYDHAATHYLGQDEAWRNVLPQELPQATSAYFGYLLIWMVLSVCLLLSPVLVRDRMRNMRPLQWSAKQGRGILKKQFTAAMLSAFLLCSINLIIFGGSFASNHVGVFANNRIFSFMLTGFSWVNLTYRNWCIAIIGMSYLICLGVAGLAFALSRFSGNYVAMLLKLIPLFVSAAILSPLLISDVFYYKNQLYRWTGVPMIELMVAGAILVLGIGLCGLSMARQRTQDLLSA